MGSVNGFGLRSNTRLIAGTFMEPWVNTLPHKVALGQKISYAPAARAPAPPARIKPFKALLEKIPVDFSTVLTSLMTL
jgi:hypothetical protein